MPMSIPAQEFDRLVEVVATLRSPQGCPWDRDQTLESLTRFVLEEAYEVVDAIERSDISALREEIGDHIFEGVLLAQVASELGVFRIEDALRTVADKLVRRHPHVFREDGGLHDAASKERAPSADAALSRWDQQKAQERQAAGETEATLGGLPKGLPSLLRAHTLGKRAAGVGFDWTGSADVMDKIREEVEELREVITSGGAIDQDRAEEEMGDLLFAMANLSRKLGIEPEAALRKANEKFSQRFNAMEHAIAESGRRMQDLSLEELEKRWQQAKKR
jgi:MazG family protein